MASRDVTADPGGADLTRRSSGGLAAAAQRLTTETKAFFKTSEWWTYLAIVIAILIAGNSVEGEEGGSDFFAADKVWLYITFCPVALLFAASSGAARRTPCSASCGLYTRASYAAFGVQGATAWSRARW